MISTSTTNDQGYCAAIRLPEVEVRVVRMPQSTEGADPSSSKMRPLSLRALRKDKQGIGIAHRLLCRGCASCLWVKGRGLHGKSKSRSLVVRRGGLCPFGSAQGERDDRKNPSPNDARDLRARWRWRKMHGLWRILPRSLAGRFRTTPSSKNWGAEAWAWCTR